MPGSQLGLSDTSSTAPVEGADSSTMKSSFRVEGVLRALRLARWWGARYSTTATVLSGNTCATQVTFFS